MQLRKELDARLAPGGPEVDDEDLLVVACFGDEAVEAFKVDPRERFSAAAAAGAEAAGAGGVEERSHAVGRKRGGREDERDSLAMNIGGMMRLHGRPGKDSGQGIQRTGVAVCSAPSRLPRPWRISSWVAMKLTVNGKDRLLSDGRTVRQLVEEMGLAKAAVAVEVNRKVVPRKEHEKTPLAEGDVVEVVTLVGGG